jgi:type I restriction enzyme S subunit
MDLKMLADNFGILLDQSDSSARLRRLVLSLAFRGAMVAQQEKDGDAAELLEKCGALAARNNRKSTRVAKVSEASESVVAKFKIPKNWKWVILADVGDIVGGGTPQSTDSSNFSSNGIPWLTPADLYGYSSKFIERGRRDISEKGLSSSSAQLMPQGSVIFSSRAPIGYVVINAVPVSTNQGFKSCVPLDKGMSEFIYYWLLYAGPEIDANSSGTTFKEISGARFACVPIPVPPLAEQHRIVKKVDELMHLCDELEQKKEKVSKTRSRLNSVSLEKLTAARNAEEFDECWERVRKNFDQIIKSDSDIHNLIQCTLTLGMKGNLSSNSSRSESGVDLVKRIATNRGMLSEPDIASNFSHPIPCEIPSNWCWTKFNYIAEIASNLVKPDQFANHPHVAPDCIEKYTGRLLEYRTVREDNVISVNHLFKAGQILYSKIRPNLCKAIISEFEGLCSADMYPLNSFLNTNFLHFYILSPVFMKMAVKKDTRVAMPKINQAELREILVPVPPEPDQEMIVNRIGRVISLCSELTKAISKTEQASIKISQKLLSFRGKPLITSLSEASQPQLIREEMLDAR